MCVALRAWIRTEAASIQITVWLLESIIYRLCFPMKMRIRCLSFLYIYAKAFLVVSSFAEFPNVLGFVFYVCVFDVVDSLILIS